MAVHREPRDSPTIHDVAALAGVSIATVSTALNHPEKVARGTTERVLDAVAHLGYVPRPVRDYWAQVRTDRVGVVAPFSSYESYGTRLVGVMRAVRRPWRELVVIDHGSAAMAESPRMDQLPVESVDGLIVMGLPITDRLVARAAERNIRLALVDARHDPLPSILVDDEKGGYLAGKRLLEHGFESFFYVSEGQVSTDYVSPGQRRILGLVRAITEAGHDRSALQHINSLNSMEGGRAVADRLVGLGLERAGILAHHDVLAAGVVTGLRRRGIRLPDDVAVIGYDGSPLAEASGLTTVRQPLEESGYLGGRLIVDPDARWTSAPVRTLGVELLEGDTA